MDILKPEFTIIDGCCYRRLHAAPDSQFPSSENAYLTKTAHVDSVKQTRDQKPQPLNSNVETMNDEEDNISSGEELEEIGRKMFKLKIYKIPKAFYGVLIGTKGQTKMRIAESTRTSVQFPKQGEDRPIEITGQSKENVLKARRRILEIAANSRHKRDVTHFVCIPCNAENVQKNFQDFKEVVLRRYKNCKGICEELFQEAVKLHLTIEVMTLLDDRERSKASKLLEDLVKSINVTPFKIHLKGLDYMNDDPSEVHVLYATLHEIDSKQSTLQSFADQIKHGFSKCGLIPRVDSNPVKLHTTLMNSRYKARKTNGEPREAFDATKIIEELKDFDFGILTVAQVRISIIHTADETGFYKSTKIVNL